MAEEKKYITIRADYHIDDGSIDFTEIDSNFDSDDNEYDRIYGMMQDSASKIARNLRKGLELKVIIND
ncbi:MAG: hypothetical protein Q8P79_02215 [Nanoarchaeota archaeon]|nr:hypothetical protein [Nanoarchaeota archaeon]